jgi:hypothetical protein
MAMNDSGREFYIIPQTGFQTYSRAAAIARARSAAKRIEDRYRIEVETSGGRKVFEVQGKKKRKNPARKRVSASFTQGLKKLNPAFKRASSVRVKKLKGGGVTITPVR